MIIVMFHRLRGYVAELYWETHPGGACPTHVHHQQRGGFMARKSQSRSQPGSSSHDPSQAVRDSAQKIWLAGLGAYERAKADGPKMFETLVQQGRGLSGRAREAADQALKNMREQASDAGGKWDKLEQVFEDRVSKSLHRLGVVSGRDVSELSRQVQELNERVRELMKGGGGAKAGGAKKKRAAGSRKKTSTAAKKPARRGARKKAA
jgi:poly(hydroxyalkanoate) granule-associated protein